MTSFTALPNDVLFAGIALIAAAAGAGFLLGGRGGRLARRIAALESELVNEKIETERVRAELAGYRRRVADHFTTTSAKLHGLTLQYRAVYEHLARGASELCPEDFRPLAGGLDLSLLPSLVGEPGAAEAPRDVTPPRTPETTDAR
jgi:hypothetical protein